MLENFFCNREGMYFLREVGEKSIDHKEENGVIDDIKFNNFCCM